MSSSKDDKTSKKNKKFKGKSGKSPDEAAGIDTRLHHADSAHHVIKYLRDTPPDLTDANGDAPVHVYVKRKDKHKFECLMTFLVHTNCIIDLVNRDGMTALHLACESNDLLSTKALIAFDANLNLVNFDNCTPLDIATSVIANMLVELDAMSAKAVKTIERQESKEYYDTHNDLSLSNELSSPSFEPPPFSDIHNTVRTRFGFNSQLFSRLNDLDLNESSIDQTNNISPVLVANTNEGLEFHDGREEEKSVLHDERTKEQGQREETQTKPNLPIVLESLPEEEQPRAPHLPIKKDRFTTPDASVEMALTEVSIMLAKENADPLSPNSSVTSGTSVLRKNPFLMSPSPLSITPHSPASPLEDSHEEEEKQQEGEKEEKEVRVSEVTPKDLALAYGDIYSPKISPGEQSPYQPVRNPFSLDLLDEDEVQTDTNGVKKAQHSEHKTVHFAESPSPEHERHLFSYTHMDGSIYNQFEDDTKKRMYEAVDSSLGDEGYAAWLQWKEMVRAKKWREELNKGLDFEDSNSKKQTSDGQHTIDHKTTPITNGRHSPPPTDSRSKPPQNLPLEGNADESPPPKPPRKHHTNAAAAAGTKRKVQSHLKRYRRIQSPTSSVYPSIVNPHMAVYQSILGSSVAPILFGAGKEKGERILCLDGGGIKGLIQIEILKCIESIAGKPITELFDWIVGTSTGGIVALGLVYANRSLDDMKRMYFELKDKVFKKKSKIISYACDTEALEELLIKTLGSELTMRSVTKPKVLITAVNKSTTRLPLVFFNNCFDNEFSDQPVWKVARYTSAAPLYFKELDHYVDGGVVANNPCDYALAEIQDYLRKPKSKSDPDNPKRPKRTKPAKNIACVVSIGCGIYPAEPIGNTDILDAMKLTKITAAPHRLKHLVTLLTSALSKSDDVARICQSNCEQLEIPFYRFSPRLGEEVGTAETDNEKLCDIIIGAKKLLVESEDHLMNLVEHLGCKLGREPL